MARLRRWREVLGLRRRAGEPGRTRSVTSEKDDQSRIAGGPVGDEMPSGSQRSLAVDVNHLRIRRAPLGFHPRRVGAPVGATVEPVADVS